MSRSDAASPGASGTFRAPSTGLSPGAAGPREAGAAQPRVGYVTKMYPRFSETFIVNEVLALEAAGLDLDIVSLRPPADGRFHAALARVAAPVTYLPSSGIKAPDLWEALRAARDLPGLWPAVPELVAADVRDAHQAVLLAQHVHERALEHLHAHFASVGATVARLAAAIAGVTYSFTAHAKDIFHDDVDPEDLRRKLRDAAAVVTVSEHNLAYLRERFGADAAQVRRVYNGLDLESFGFRDPTPDLAADPTAPPTVVSVGRLVEKKGMDVLVEACALLVARGRSLRCAIVGEGALRGPLAAQIARLGLEDTVELCGPMPQGRVREVVRDAAVFAAPCVVGSDGNRDGLPTVLLEAMALGTPCVSTDVTGIPEVLRDGETGLMVPRRDSAALAVALERLLDDAALRRRLAVAARALVEADFDTRTQAQQLLAMYRQVTGRAAGGAPRPGTVPAPEAALADGRAHDREHTCERATAGAV